MKTKKLRPEFICFALLLLLALICIVSVTKGSHQATLPIPMPQEFVGEYSYDGQNWFPLTQQAELSAFDGDLILRGSFLRDMQQGWLLNYYRNHIGILIRVNGETVYMDDTMAADALPKELFASMCAREWMCFAVPEITSEDAVEIRLHNSHRAGNKSAYKEFLTTLCVQPMGTTILQENLDAYGDIFRVAGGMLAVASLMILGASVAAAITRIPVWSALIKLGLLTLFAGGWITVDTIDVSFWRELNVFNTYGGQLCMMLAAFCLISFVSDAFTGKIKKTAKGFVLFSALFDSVLIVLSFTGVCAIFDTLPYWIGVQLVLCPAFMICCVLELHRERKPLLVPISGLVLFAAILLDIAGVGATIVWRSPCVKISFAVLFVVYITACASGIVKNYRASARAARLEKELEDSRIAIMLSQIKPHFLYNVLNAIYHLYRKEPETAQEAVSGFAEYLRCNMLSLEKSEPIPFAEEYRHIQTYLSLEQIRFRDKLDVVYDVEFTDFKLPPLTVEPLVENAVKHGVTKKRGGGTVTISTRRTDSGYLVTVADTGVGFDVENYMEDGKPHVGIRNVRERLQSMVGGSLSIQSTSEGTAAVVSIPAKEAKNTK